VQKTQESELREIMATCKRGFAAVAVFSLFINLLMLTAPLFMLQVFDRVLSSRSTETLILLLVIAVAALLVFGLLDGLRGIVMVRLSSWLDTKIGGAVLSGSVWAAVNKGKDPSVQGLRDLSTFRTFLSGPAMFPILDAPWTPIFLAVMFMLHPILGWLSLLGALVLFSLALANEITTRKLLAMSGDASVKAMNRAESAARNADVIEAMGMMPNLLARWNQENAASLNFQAQASVRSGSISAASKFLRICLQLGVMAIGAWLVIENELTPGGMIAGSILMGRALAPVEQAIGSWKSVVAARNAYLRVRKQLAETPSRGEGMPLPAPEGRLSAHGVAYIYPGAADPLLKNINFELEPGEVMGLIGPTAVGKTTLARLLVGNLTPRRGQVRLDGMDVSKWEREDVGQHIGYLPQDIELFGGTVHENIARMGEGDPEAVVAAARLAGVHKMILDMPKGYDTEIGEGGAALSGGQRQRLGLARAVYGDPKLVVLDEPNANLDGAGERGLLEAVAALKARGVTLVMIAHRRSMLQHVDKLLVLKDGTVHMFGPPEQVVPRLAAPQKEKTEETANEAEVVDFPPAKPKPRKSAAAKGKSSTARAKPAKAKAKSKARTPAAKKIKKPAAKKTAKADPSKTAKRARKGKRAAAE